MSSHATDLSVYAKSSSYTFNVQTYLHSPPRVDGIRGLYSNNPVTCCAVVAGMKATVVYSYDAEQDDELSLAVGDVIHVIAQARRILFTYLLSNYCSVACLL